MECNFENCGYYTDGECDICGMGISGEDTFCRLCKDNPNCYYKQNAELKAENEQLYEEKNCLHKIIDRLLENAGYSKDIASAEDFEDVYENMQYNKQKLLELQKTLQEIKAIAEEDCKQCFEIDGFSKPDDCGICPYNKILQKITKAEEE